MKAQMSINKGFQADAADQPAMMPLFQSGLSRALAGFGRPNTLVKTTGLIYDMVNVLRIVELS